MENIDIRRIKEVPVGRIERGNVTLEELAKLISNTQNHLYQDYLRFVQERSEQRILRTIAKHKERFARRFSLDAVVREFGLHDTISFPLVLYLQAGRLAQGGYGWSEIALLLYEKFPSKKEVITAGPVVIPISASPASQLDQFDSFIDKVVTRVNQQDRDLVLAHLQCGIGKALAELTSVLTDVIAHSLREEDASHLFFRVINARKESATAQKKLEKYGSNLSAAHLRIKNLELVIKAAVAGIEGTKSSFHSEELEKVREKLEEVLT